MKVSTVVLVSDIRHLRVCVRHNTGPESSSSVSLTHVERIKLSSATAAIFRDGAASGARAAACAPFRRVVVDGVVKLGPAAAGRLIVGDGTVSNPTRCACANNLRVLQNAKRFSVELCLLERLITEHKNSQNLGRVTHRTTLRKQLKNLEE